MLYMHGTNEFVLVTTDLSPITFLLFGNIISQSCRLIVCYVSQVLVLPPYQRQGHGAELLLTFYRECWDSATILDITGRRRAVGWARLGSIRLHALLSLTANLSIVFSFLNMLVRFSVVILNCNLIVTPCLRSCFHIYFLYLYHSTGPESNCITFLELYCFII